jgi:hypothetical protein
MIVEVPQGRLTQVKRAATEGRHPPRQAARELIEGFAARTAL